MSEPPKTEPAPEWAKLFARGLRRIGMSVPAIEQQLVAKGLAPDDAKNIAMELIEGEVVQGSASYRSYEWAKPFRLFLSAAVGGMCLLLAYWFGRGPSTGIAFLWVAPALFAIWLPDITDMEGSDWAATWWVYGWAHLLIYLAYRIFVAIMWP